MRTIRRREEPWRHSAWTYRKYVMTHYAQCSVVAAALVVAFATASIVGALLALIAAEAAAIALLPKARAFREEVDDRLERAALARAAGTRALLLTRMSEEHRRELERLEDLACRVGALGDGPRGGKDDWLGFDSLLSAYIRLAVAYRESDLVFHAAYEGYFVRELMELERRHASAAGEARTWAARRLAIVRERRETWSRARDQRAIMQEQLATIAELVRWMYEQAAVGRSVAAPSGLADTLESCAKNAPAVREIAALAAESDVDPEVVRAGRVHVGPVDGPVASHARVRVDAAVDGLSASREVALRARGEAEAEGSLEVPSRLQVNLETAAE